MRFRILLLLFFSLLGSSVFSQYDTVQEVEVVEDSISYDSEEEFVLTDSLVGSNYSTNNTLYPKNFSPDLKNKYKGNEFDYGVSKPQESLWDIIKRQIAKLLSRIFKDIDPNKATNYTVIILRTIGILVIGSLLYLLIRYLISKEGNFLFGKKNRKIKIATQDLEENIHEINFPQSILKFEKQQDYRSAIRYHFLFAIKKLSDKDLIKWNPEKTNRDYLRELKNISLKEDFSRIIYIYDYIWYGEFYTEEKDYQYYRSYFNKF
ncbi:hypothetical protein J2X97_002762 [Epilithonimonas hungarica]|uniref:DUF4129 domain-containing protein n=1 Tax=Epilithonimonas hungarica TaxID=454006 RepID=UPI00277EFC3E|nr:DUF4129 domain-containing protein [Epilithonimonas hungarica]MDP9957096.1 hypothetical protein [Epilithonimonas hungarica]